MATREEQYWRRFEKDAPRFEQELLEQFGPPEEVVARETERHRRRIREGLTGMDEEQADWEEGLE